MQASGYNQEHRYNVLKSAFNAYNKIKEDDINGIRQMYRKTTWNNIERRAERKHKRNNWFGNYDTVLFVSATPQSELKRLYEDEIRKRKMKIKVVERSGIKIKDTLQKKSTLNDKQCKDDCFICTTTQKGNCMSSGVTYMINCNSDHDDKIYQYDGRTMKNGYARGKEHIMKLNKKHNDSVLWKHCQEEHNGNVQEFSMSITGRCRNDATLLQILEAINIRNQREKGITSMNSRNEWGYIGLPHAEINE